MAVHSCIFRNSFTCLATLGFFLAFAQSLGFGFLTILLTSSTLILCPVIICHSKSSRRELNENSSSVSCKGVFSEQSVLQQAEVNQSVEEELQKKPEICENKKKNLFLSLPEALSENESIDHTTSSEEYSENDFIFRENNSQSSECSDGSISDEESLFEIALPTGHYVESKIRQKKWSDCSLESHFRQQTWMEMLNEMNEENFIEIDICMGSIKCSRFEIEA